MAATSEMQLNSSMRCAKYMLLTISFMFAITALLLMLVGSAIQTIFYDFRQFVHDHFLSPGALLIAVGFILLCVATLGAYGGSKESVMLINVYGVCLFLVFILEISASIAAVVMQDQVREMLQVTMSESMAAYDTSDISQAGVDFMQSSLICCGIDGPEDWSKYLNPSIHHMNKGILVPHSCCAIYMHYMNDTQECVGQYQSGCFDQMNYIISENAWIIASSAATVAFVQFLGSICAFMLAKTLRRHKSLREVRRLQLQQSLDTLISGGKIAPPMNSLITDFPHFEKEPMAYTPTSPSVIN